MSRIASALEHVLNLLIDIERCVMHRHARCTHACLDTAAQICVRGTSVKKSERRIWDRRTCILEQTQYTYLRICVSQSRDQRCRVRSILRRIHTQEDASECCALAALNRSLTHIHLSIELLRTMPPA
ncbi:hypothetical protein [Caballeronia sp. BR00000012568055]|uniref:hypothetical protein n=1 Tax=Caballeronia sp. BR00000012568055 TaxID=2918761 RepID=UPI0023F75729|nr:hypothetical protein [Caballeronia sp. BR00000012568055]